MKQHRTKAMILSSTILGIVSTLGTTSAFGSKDYRNVLKSKEVSEKIPRIGSQSAIVISVPVGQILFEKDADEQRPIASLSKLMSAIVYMENCSHYDLDGLHEMSARNRELAKGGDKTHLTTGWSYTRRDLLKAALMRSDNRALPALMESCGMILQEFVMLMNAKAKSLNLPNTSFAEPTGLSQYNVSTAREYAKITIEATRFPELTNIMQTKNDIIVGYKNGKARKFEARNTNYILGRRNVDVIGGKTGYTDIARYCFTILNRLVDNSAVTMVFLGAEGKHTRFGDFSRIQNWLNTKLAKYMAHGTSDAESDGS
ncbi:MAG: serine hydrolase [Proteobacteria bacterium]|nr:serine hydrolase [Pseudomonadota bacterium]